MVYRQWSFSLGKSSSLILRACSCRTGKLEIKYRKNVPIGKPLKIVGKVIENKGRIAKAWGGIYDAETNELLAEGTGMHINVPT
ncbi:MAG: hypothetical protein ACKOBL_20630, partial [Chloroflexota bacterium]